MKQKLIIGLTWFILAQGLIAADHSAEIDAKTIIRKSMEAMGGVKKIESVQTIDATVTYEGHSGKNYSHIKRPVQYRSGDLKNSYTMIFNGREAAFIRKKKDIETPVIEFVRKTEMADFIAEPGFFTLYFWDFPSTYLGRKVINKRPCHQLRVRMEFGVKMDYYIDCRSYLPVMTVAHVRNRGKEIKWTREYDDFKAVDGIRYPHRFLYYFDINKKTRIPKTGRILSLKFNRKFQPGYFKLPPKSGHSQQ